MTDIDNVLLFRIGSAFSVLGVSLICFLLGGLAREKSPWLFSQLHSGCAGIMLGMGFLFDDPDGIAHMNHESYYSAVYIAAISFIAMIAGEQVNSTSMYDYSAVVSSEDSELDEGDDGLQIELGSIHNSGLIPDSTGDQSFGNGQNRQSKGNFLQGASGITFKFHPLILLVCASTADMVGGIHLSCEKHASVSLLALVVVHKALMATAFGTLLESSTAPRSIFLYFMLTYCFSATVGILAGTVMSKYGFVTANLLRSLQRTDLVITALAAGVYLYIATMKMIPAGVLTNTESLQDSTGPAASSSAFRNNEKAVKYVCFVVGFLAVVVPKLLL